MGHGAFSLHSGNTKICDFYRKQTIKRYSDTFTKSALLNSKRRETRTEKRMCLFEGPCFI